MNRKTMGENRDNHDSQTFELKNGEIRELIMLTPTNAQKLLYLI